MWKSLVNVLLPWAAAALTVGPNADYPIIIPATNSSQNVLAVTLDPASAPQFGLAPALVVSVRYVNESNGTTDSEFIKVPLYHLNTSFALNLTNQSVVNVTLSNLGANNVDFTFALVGSVEVFEGADMLLHMGNITANLTTHSTAPLDLAVAGCVFGQKLNVTSSLNATNFTNNALQQTVGNRRVVLLQADPLVLSSPQNSSYRLSARAWQNSTAYFASNGIVRVNSNSYAFDPLLTSDDSNVTYTSIIGPDPNAVKRFADCGIPSVNLTTGPTKPGSRMDLPPINATSALAVVSSSPTYGNFTYFVQNVFPALLYNPDLNQDPISFKVAVIILAVLLAILCALAAAQIIKFAK